MTKGIPLEEKRRQERAAKAKAKRPNGPEPPPPASDDDYGVAREQQPAIAAEDWPAPRPITTELKPVPVFEPAKMLPEPLASWVHQQAHVMSCPPEFIAVPALVTLGSLIGTRCAIKPKRHDDWIEVPNLWGAVVGPPGSKKSPAFSVAFAPLNHLIAAAMKEHEAELKAYRAAKAVYDAETEVLTAALKPAVRKGNEARGEAAAAYAAHIDNAPTPPSARRYKVNDCTMEKLGELLKNNPTGLLVARDELVGLMAGWDREGREGERAFFLEAWNGKASYTVDRIKRGTTTVPHLCLSLIGGIQPGKLITYLEQIASSLGDDGLLQRFQLLVYPDAGDWQWRDLPQRHATQMLDLFVTIANATAADWQTTTPAGKDKMIPFLSLDDDARQAFSLWSQVLHGRIAGEKDGMICQHLSKYEKLLLGLALIFHLVEGGSGALTTRAIRRAILWCDFLEAHARRCYGLLRDDGFRAAETLSTRLQEGALEDGFTSRDVSRHHWRYLSDDKTIQAALTWLEDDGWIRSRTARLNAVGRPTIRYFINPKVQQP